MTRITRWLSLLVRHLVRQLAGKGGGAYCMLGYVVLSVLSVLSNLSF